MISRSEEDGHMATRLEIIKAEQHKVDVKMAKEHLRIEVDNLILAAKEFKKGEPTDLRFKWLTDAVDEIEKRIKEVERLTGGQLI
jgi:hypothetical protein